MASTEPSSPQPPAVAVAVRRSGRGSRRAARWAASNLSDGSCTIALVHVIPPVSFVPSPTGERVPVAMVAREVAEVYVQDRRERVQEELLPFRRLCSSRANVETVVLEGDGVAEALVRYVEESGIRNLVLGLASCWLQRLLNHPDVPSAVLKTMPSSCNVFVVSKRRLTMKLSQPPTSKSNTSVWIQSISHKAFRKMQKNLFLNNISDDGTPKISGEAILDSCSQSRNPLGASAKAGESLDTHGRGLLGSLGVNTPGTEGNKNYGDPGSSKGVPDVAVNSFEESQTIDEVVTLRKELQDTLVMYDKACEDLIHAKKKIQVLSNECTEETRKVVGALQQEELMMQVVADEKEKRLEAIKAIEQAKKSFTKEVYSRHKAEMVASMMSSEKEKVVDALLSRSKSCRRYSRKEIELATDNFSEARKIGEGGYGNVYRCTLDYTEVAVKVFQQDSRDKTDEFLREVEILSQLHHTNLVLLLGFCPEIGCLVYEYMENGSLEDQLINNLGQQPLHWFLRFRIIFEVSCGLAFLHGRKPEPIVHRDLKPANILLDKHYESKIGDVGFAKLISDLVPDWQTEYKETVIAGTLYYMDPEYQLTGTVRPKSDLFALGVVILQLLTGKRPIGLIMSVEDAIKVGKLSDILDKSQVDWPITETEMLAKLGLRCTALKCRDRPDLESEVMPELKELLYRLTANLKFINPNVGAPSHFICPITQEVMDDPYVAADGHTYEHMAIKAWLKKHKISPVTRHRFPNSSIIPNHSLRATIQQWKSQVALTKA